MDEQFAGLPVEVADATDLPHGAQNYSGVDGRRGPAVDLLNRALERILAEDHGNFSVQVNPSGAVNRAHYAARLGVSYTHLDVTP